MSWLPARFRGGRPVFDPETGVKEKDTPRTPRSPGSLAPNRRGSLMRQASKSYTCASMPIKSVPPRRWSIGWDYGYPRQSVFSA